MKETVLIVLPARFASTRFPGKVLAPLRGKPVVWWCYEAAARAKVGEVLVATEDRRVVEAVAARGGRAVLTPASCRSGSDRVQRAAAGTRATVVVNVQADEPMLSASTIRKTVRALLADPGADIATAAAPLRDARRLSDPNTVKVVLDRRGRALYFTRSPIPYPRNPAAAKGTTHWQHIGIYAYRRAALERFVKLKSTPLESLESLEQLRALENGMAIAVAKVAGATVGVDTPADLARVEALLGGGPVHA